MKSHATSEQLFVGSSGPYLFATAGANGVRLYRVDAKCGVDSGREFYANALFGRSTVWFVYTSGEVLIVLRHSGRTTYIRGYRMPVAKVMLVHGISDGDVRSKGELV